MFSEFTKKPIPVKAKRIKNLTRIKTLEGTMIGSPGDWMIIGVNGEKYPCKDDVFRKSYIPSGKDKCSFCVSGDQKNRSCDIAEICLFEWRRS
jgi:hypothetical protein